MFSFLKVTPNMFFVTTCQKYQTRMNIRKVEYWDWIRVWKFSIQLLGRCYLYEYPDFSRISRKLVQLSFLSFVSKLHILFCWLLDWLWRVCVECAHCHMAEKLFHYACLLFVQDALRDLVPFIQFKSWNLQLH